MCGQCTVSSRDCVFPADFRAGSGPEASTRARHSAAAPNDHNNSGDGLRQQDEQQPRGSARPSDPNVSHSPILGLRDPSSAPGASSLGTEKEASHVQQPPPPIPSHSRGNTSLTIQGPSAQDSELRTHDTIQLGVSPDASSYEKWSAVFASTRWLNLLANDAAQADSRFSLAPSPTAVIQNPGPRYRTAISAHVSPALLNGQAQLPENLNPETERQAWQSDGDVTLTKHESVLFRLFTTRCARWLEACDPQRHFSTYAIHLALKNQGLMKAILAVSAKYRSRCLGNSTDTSVRPAIPDEDENNSDWIQYYYETLHYIQGALAYSSYTHSEEVLATAIVISVYEMLDESDGTGNWQRHLKGVFWIQRSQDVDGECGGLRQSVWWAWLTQDIWAAFRERRSCFSFWRPIKDVHELNNDELANRVIYLLSQAVNYSAQSHKAEEAGTSDPSAAIHLQSVREQLLHKMDQWKACLGDAYNILPTPKSAGDVFTPLWVHPPHFGTALQAYSFARVLLTLHGPQQAGLTGFAKTQRTLTAAVETICGVAMELEDESCQILSAQCLYVAGLCVQGRVRRGAVLGLMKRCEERVKWAPMAIWRDDLRREWAKVDREAGITVEKEAL